MISSQDIDIKLKAALDYAYIEELSASTFQMLSAFSSDRAEKPLTQVKRKINECTYISLQSTLNKLQLLQSPPVITLQSAFPKDH